MMLKVFRPVVTLAAVLLGVVLTGCAGGDPTPMVTPSQMPTPTGPPVLTDDELYALAVSQYEKADAIIIGVDREGGAVSLPDASRDVMMDPAWTAYNDLYLQVLLSGEHFAGDPQYQILAVARLDDDQVAQTVVAIQTCEVAQGAKTLDKDDNVVQDGTPVMKLMKAYLKYDDTDWQLKVFVLNGERIDSCPL